MTPERLPAAEPQTLPARLADVVADEGRYGPRWIWWFEAEGPTGPMKLRTWTSRHLHPMARAGSCVRALLGRDPAAEERIEPASLVGRTCAVAVETNANGYLVVTDVLPPEDAAPI